MRATFAEDPNWKSVLAFHRKLPGYAPPPLVDARNAAQQLSVSRLWVKDESRRLDLAAYKILGASWAVFRALDERFGPFDEWSTLDELSPRIKRQSPPELVAASEGNHGGAVARMARWLGLQAHIFVPRDASSARIERIRDEGARITVVDGVYDDAVETATRREDSSHLLISDAGLSPDQQSAIHVIEGYATLFHEIEDQLTAAGEPWPDFVAVQMGVGALAASAVRHYSGSNTRVIGVEPAGAACILKSMAAGCIVETHGPYDPRMAGLNCGRPSCFAWPLLSKGLSACVEIQPASAVQAAQLLALDGIESSPSGAAGLAAVPEMLDLRQTSSVLIISTEGPV
jgi:diaminopropionate ammonia-lyase